MPTLAEMEALLAQVRAANGPDRKIDYALCIAFGVDPWIGALREYIDFTMDGSKVDKATPKITASIDAALALVERANTSSAAPDVMLSDALNRMGRDGFDPSAPLAPQIARSLLIEFLSAKIEEARNV